MSTAADIITPARDILNDANVRWTDAELLRWTSQGQKAIALLRPDATAQIKNLILVAGTRQTLSGSDIQLLDIIRNMGASGTTPGRPVSLVEREFLDTQINWHTGTPAAYIRNFAYDERSPRDFWCYPPATAGIQVQATVSVEPAAVTALNNTLAIPSIFDSALMDFVLYRSFQKGATVGNQSRASVHLQSFGAALGQEAMAKIAASPNSFNIGGVSPAN